jgi:hypothetical protein
MLKRLSAVVVVLAGAMSFIPQIASAQAKPNFAGTWTMNMEKSDLGAMPKPKSQVETITQTADAITIAIAADRNEMGKQNYKFSAKFDGSETPFPADAFPADSPFKILSAKAEWQGSSLVITQKTSFQDVAGTVKTIYTLSEDGKMLTSAMHIAFGDAEFDAKTVYDKS